MGSAASNANPDPTDEPTALSREVSRQLSKCRMQQPPTAWITSSGLASERLVCEFLKVVLHRRGVLHPRDDHADAATLRSKYAATLATVKVVHMNDGNYHKDNDAALEGRRNRVTFFWDMELVENCALRAENITKVCLYEKPWLFNRPGVDGKYDKQEPNITSLSAEDEASYTEALALTKTVVDKIRAGDKCPVPCGTQSPADVLAEASQVLEKKHKAALDAWCRRVFSENDIVVGQGGDVVMVNLAFQVNQPFASKLVHAVRSGQVIFASMSASTMVCSKSMEMTGEILPGSLENFSVDAKYLTCGFDAVDLDGDGIETNVLGALPMYKSPFAMRPHFSEAWLEKVLAKNLEAEAEFELEMGVEVDDELVATSVHGLDVALRLLNIISANAKEQDNPIYLPLKDGEAVQCLFLDSRELFSVVPNGPVGVTSDAWRCGQCLPMLQLPRLQAQVMPRVQLKEPVATAQAAAPPVSRRDVDAAEPPSDTGPATRESTTQVLANDQDVELSKNANVQDSSGGHMRGATDVRSLLLLLFGAVMGSGATLVAMHILHGSFLLPVSCNEPMVAV